MNSPGPKTDNVLFVLAKHPFPGKVKTRLATSIGEVRAAALYRAFLTDLASRFLTKENDVSFDLCWAFVPSNAPFPELVSSLSHIPLTPSVSFRGFPQSDLLQHQIELIKEARALGYRRIVIVTTDSPHLPNRRITDAFQALIDTDVVIGPAEDGGYYLLGIGCKGDVLKETQMSTRHVTDTILRNARDADLSVRLLPTLLDIDTQADLDAFIKWLANEDEDPCPETSRLLSFFQEEGTLKASELPSSLPRTSLTPSIGGASIRVAAAIRSLLSPQANEPGRAACIVLPDSPERNIALQACDILGFVVVFTPPQRLSENELADMLQRTKSPILIIADWCRADGLYVPTKTLADRASVLAPDLETVLVVRHLGRSVSWLDGRDFWWHNAISGDFQ